MVRRRRAGLSLIEAVVAMVVLGAGLLPVLALVSRSGSLIRTAEGREGAVREAGIVLDSLVRYGAPAGGASTRGRYALRWAASRDSLGVTLLTVEATYVDGGTTRADTFLAQAAPWPREIRHAP
jgi:Tfp pilus assembly protein PilV